MEMRQLIEQVQTSMEEAEPNPLMRVALGILVGGKGNFPDTDHIQDRAAEGWGSVKKAAQMLEKLALAGGLGQNAGTRRQVSMLIQVLTEALEATGAAESVQQAGKVSSPPAAVPWA